jgi:hypothetical protein
MIESTSSSLKVMEPAWDGDRLVFEIETPHKKFTPYFKSDVVTLQTSAEASLLLGVLPAMQLGLPLTPLMGVSETLVDNLDKFSSIFCGWFPRYKPLRMVTGEKYLSAPVGSGRVGSFFTGGVDSFYTFLKHRHEITDLIYVHGYDLQLDDHTRRRAISLMGRSIAEEAGIRFVEIETDSQELFKAFGHWGVHSHGIALGVAGRLLAGIIDKIYVPSSFAQEDLMPWGSHPDTDPLLSDERLQFIHDGCEASRVQKIKTIRESQLALDHLRVCWERVEGAYNCGICEKCLRTMTTLFALGVLQNSKTFPHVIDVQRIRSLLLTSDSARKFTNENLRLMEEKGMQSSAVYRAWSHVLNRSDFHNKVIWRYRRSRGKLKRAVRKVAARFTSSGG